MLKPASAQAVAPSGLVNSAKSARSLRNCAKMGVNLTQKGAYVAIAATLGVGQLARHAFVNQPTVFMAQLLMNSVFVQRARRAPTAQHRGAVQHVVPVP